MKNFSKNLQKTGDRIINQKTGNETIKNEENKLYLKKKVCHICKKEFSTDDDNKKYHKVWITAITVVMGTAHVYNLRQKTPKEISVVFHNRSKHDYHFIIKGLAEGLEGQLECLGENMEKKLFQYRQRKLEIGKIVTCKTSTAAVDPQHLKVEVVH